MSEPLMLTIPTLRDRYLSEVLEPLLQSMLEPIVHTTLGLLYSPEQKLDFSPQYFCTGTVLLYTHTKSTQEPSVPYGEPFEPSCENITSIYTTVLEQP